MGSLWKLTTVWIFLLIFSLPVLADDDDDAKEHAEKTNTAAVSDKEGLKLSEKIKKTIRLKTQEIKGKGPVFELPINSLVYHQNEIGIYRERDEWFKLVGVEILSKSPTTVKLKCSELTPEDHVVIQGAALLRVAEIAAKSGIEGEGL